MNADEKISPVVEFIKKDLAECKSHLENMTRIFGKESKEAEYWQGRVDAAQFTKDTMRSAGISFN